MKKALFILLLVFSLIVITENQYCYGMDSEDITVVEKFVLNENEFVENGCKLEYTLDSSLENELNRIYNILVADKSLSVVKNKTNITALGKSVNYNINLYYYKKCLKVDIIIENRDKYKSIDELKELSYNIRNEKKISERYFSYIKVKIINRETDLIEAMEFNNIIKNVDGIDISNGKVYKATTERETPINIGQINYNTGSYLIIGTPIIFITY